MPRPSSPAARRRGVRRGESGLTTLEWLLIVAAVAAMAALAVLLVQRAVVDTAESIPTEARLAAAQLLATKVERDAKAATAGDFDTWGEWERHFKGRCDRIGILYTDPDIRLAASEFHGAQGGTTFDATAAVHAAAADTTTATATKAQVACAVT